MKLVLHSPLHGSGIKIRSAGLYHWAEPSQWTNGFANLKPFSLFSLLLGFFFFFLFLELRTEPRTQGLRLLGKRSTTEVNPQPPSSIASYPWVVLHGVVVSKHLPQATDMAFGLFITAVREGKVLPFGQKCPTVLMASPQNTHWCNTRREVPAMLGLDSLMNLRKPIFHYWCRWRTNYCWFPLSIRGWVTLPGRTVLRREQEIQASEWPTQVTVGSGHKDQHLVSCLKR